jgi:CBS domain-containing protein
MTHLIVLILDDLKRMPDLLKAWRSLGLPGATILESVGAFRATTWLSRVGLGALDHLFEADEVRRRTLLLAVEDERALDRAIAEAERVMDGFERPNSGLLLVLPIMQVRGMHKVRPQLRVESLPQVLQPEWMIRRDTTIETIADSMNLQPVTVTPEAPLDEVARVMLEHPRVQVACVVNPDGRLAGLLDLKTVAEDLFFHVIPEEFLSKIAGLDDVVAFAQRSVIRSAGDAMREPVWVRRGETVKTAFQRMHQHSLPGLPVLDDCNHVTGFINLLELMSIFMAAQAQDSSQPESA